MERFFTEGKNSPYYQEIKSTFFTMEKEFEHILKSDHRVLTKAATHLLKSGGKRLRPALVLLGGRLGTQKDSHQMPLALAIETVHMATLVHDDVVDSAALRRGKPTVKAKWGNEVSVFTGTYLLAKAMSLMAGYRDSYINHRLSDVAMEMCRGEIDQMNGAFRIDENIDTYMKRIKQKTAYLLSASCELGAHVSSAPQEIVAALKNYGEAIGMAFQITDDILDYRLNNDAFGKVSGGDIREGIATLPLIYTLKHTPQKERLLTIFSKRQKSDEEVKEVIRLVSDSGGIEYAESIAQKHIDKAKEAAALIPQPELKEVYHNIADFILTRNQ
ncbi:MAG: polyprenyl synthetase family protein [Bacillota bacterium]|nr:polyprenyl synthetase family protein [Bacillota bacterium]